MRITKHEHACLVIEKAEQRLVIDPGSFTTPLLGTDDVVAIVVTHQHPDHWTPEQLRWLLDRNPDALLYGPAGFAEAAQDFPVIVVKEGEEREAGPFTLQFFGENHAVIHESIPVIDNVGVMVDSVLFYPGDAYTVPPVPVDTLAVPSGAPWLKIGDVMDYVAAVSPRRSFPTHQMGLSQIGQNMHNDRIKSVAVDNGGEFFALEPGDSLDL